MDIIAYEVILKDKKEDVNEKMFSYNHRFDIINVCKLTKDLIIFAQRAGLISEDSFKIIISCINSIKLNK